ncbi:lipopolysaccharide biosynthesis protein [Gallibacterium trehalosifermentans]|uniref:Lipopolysaccharide biosynthesis protein n=1 Tax=Gallibacterium trehalosifermentans TaxID=516935 RepID=A0ABV6GY27_9PAST
MNRTNKSIKNISYNIFFFTLGIILSFFSRSLFIKSLGDELVGLNITINNVIGILNLSELGIYAAISFLLYKPLHDNDKNSIIAIMSLFKKLYRYIGIFIFIFSIILTPFLSYWFQEENVIWYYPILAFWIFISGSLSTYFFNYRQVLFWANQEGYKVISIIEWTAKLKTVFQIICVLVVNENEYIYIYWLSLELIMNILQVIFIEKKINLNFSWLNSEPHSSKVQELKPIVYRQIKRVFCYRVSSVLNLHISPLFVYIFLTLKVVTSYTNYLLLVKLLNQISQMITGGIFASLGNLMIENNKEKEKNVFYEFASLKTFLGGFMAFGFFFNVDSLIILLFGEAYLLDKIDKILLSIFIFIMTIRDIPESFLFAKGIYQDVGAPIIELIIYLAGLLILGWAMGLTGIIISNIISYLFILIWKPIYLERFFHHIRYKNYFYFIFKNILLLLMTYIMYVYFLDIFEGLYGYNIIILQIFLSGILLGTIMVILFYIFNNYFRLLLKRTFTFI